MHHLTLNNEANNVRSINVSFPKGSYHTCFARFLLYAANLSEIKFPLDLGRSANFGSHDSCVEDAVYHHRFETRTQLRYRIKVVFKPVNPLPFLWYNGVKYQENVASELTFYIWICRAIGGNNFFFLRFSSEKYLHCSSVFRQNFNAPVWILNTELYHYANWIQLLQITDLNFDIFFIEKKRSAKKHACSRKFVWCKNTQRDFISPYL